MKNPEEPIPHKIAVNIKNIVKYIGFCIGCIDKIKNQITESANTIADVATRIEELFLFEYLFQICAILISIIFENNVKHITKGTAIFKFLSKNTILKDV